MSEGPQYTSCVEKENWISTTQAIGVANIAAAVAAAVLVLSGFPGPGLLLAFAAAAKILRKVAGYLLHRKLVCMQNAKRRVFNDPDPERVCVVGSVLDFEKVGEDKSGFETIDNDFGLNLFLGPIPQSKILTESTDNLLKALEKSPQGDLIQNPDAPGPEPPKLKRKDDPSQDFGPMPVGFTGYKRDVMVSSAFPRLIPANVFRDTSELVKVDPKFQQLYNDALPLSPGVDERFRKAVHDTFNFGQKKVPALHCEFEGSRIADVFGVLDVIHVECDTTGFWGFLCDLLNLILAIIFGIPSLIAAIIAWATADDGDMASAGGAGIRLGDPIVVRGRWVYDSGHSGYNEIHAVRTVQITLPPPPPDDEAAFIQFRESWCSELAKVPPVPPVPPGTGQPPPDDSGMTDDQQDTWDGQGKPENHWTYHPAIDGCAPKSTEPEPPH